MDRFHASLGVVRRWEGGLVDHPKDPGGLTKWGISLRFLKLVGVDLNGDGKVDGQDIRGMTEVQVAELYREHFWVPARCYDLPAGLDLAVFDCAVNQGVGRAVRLLQKAARVKADGILGPATLAAVRGRNDPRALLEEFMARRAVHYSSLAIVAVFGLGWFRRLFNVFAEARQVCAP